MGLVYDRRQACIQAYAARQAHRRICRTGQVQHGERQIGGVRGQGGQRRGTDGLDASGLNHPRG